MVDSKEGVGSKSILPRGKRQKSSGSVRELSEAIALELNVPTRTANRVLYGVLDCIIAELNRHGALCFKGYATLAIKPITPRTYKHPLTKETALSRRTHRLVVKISDKLDRTLRAKRTQQQADA